MNNYVVKVLVNGKINIDLNSVNSDELLDICKQRASMTNIKYERMEILRDSNVIIVYGYYTMEITTNNLHEAMDIAHKRWNLISFDGLHNVKHGQFFVKQKSEK